MKYCYKLAKSNIDDSYVVEIILLNYEVYLSSGILMTELRI